MYLASFMLPLTPHPPRPAICSFMDLVLPLTMMEKCGGWDGSIVQHTFNMMNHLRRRDPSVSADSTSRRLSYCPIQHIYCVGNFPSDKLTAATFELRSIVNFDSAVIQHMTCGLTPLVMMWWQRLCHTMSSVMTVTGENMKLKGQWPLFSKKWGSNWTSIFRDCQLTSHLVTWLINRQMTLVMSSWGAEQGWLKHTISRLTQQNQW